MAAWTAAQAEAARGQRPAAPAAVAEPATSTASGAVPVPRRAPTLLLILVCMAQFMIVLDVSIVNVALPSIRNDLGFTTTGLQWVVNAYTLTFAGFLMLGGRAADLLGRRRMFLLGTAAFSIASLLCATTSSQGLLIGARALQGIAGAVVSPATLAILTSSFTEGSERNRAVGVWGAMSGLGASAGVLIGGVLTSTAGWPAIFLVNVPIGLVVVILGRRVIQETKRDDVGHFDLAGAILITLGLVGVVYGIVRTDTVGWSSAGALVPIAAGVSILALFGLWEQRIARAPLIPLAIFRRRPLVAANLVILLLYAALFSTFFFVTLYMQEVLGYSALQAGLGFLPMTLTVFTASQFAPRIIARLGSRRTITLGMLLAATGLACFTGVHPGASFVAAMLPGSLLAGTGMGIANVGATVGAVRGVPTEESGLASGLVNSSRFIGGALGLAVLSTLAGSHTANAMLTGVGQAQALTDGYGAAFRVAVVISLVGAAVAAVLLRPSRPRTVEVETEPEVAADLAA